MAEKRPFDPHNIYVHMRGDNRSSAVVATSEFWSEVMSGKRKYDGRMLMAFHMSEDMPHWEMHPAGAEFIYLTAGAMTVVLDQGEGEYTWSVRTGQAGLIPSGIWHRFTVSEAVDVVAITAGEGTQHRAHNGSGNDQ